MFNLTGRVIVISGASSGLGGQMAKGFAEQGATVVVMARRLEKLEALAEEIKKNGTDCYAVRCDVTSQEAIEAAAKQVVEKYGKVDVLVNCAGIGMSTGVLDGTKDEWDKCMACDLDSVFLVTKAFGTIMKEHHNGRVINIASMYGLVGQMALNSIGYNAAKGGVVNFTRAAAAELAQYGITVNCLCPGFFETELTRDTLNTPEFSAFTSMMVPLKRYGKAGELNAAAVFLASDEASYVTGVVLPVDGGYTCI